MSDTAYRLCCFVLAKPKTSNRRAGVSRSPARTKGWSLGVVRDRLGPLDRALPKAVDRWTRVNMLLSHTRGWGCCSFRRPLGAPRCFLTCNRPAVRTRRSTSPAHSQTTRKLLRNKSETTGRVYACVSGVFCLTEPLNNYFLDAVPNVCHT